MTLFQYASVAFSIIAVVICVLDFMKPKAAPKAPWNLPVNPVNPITPIASRPATLPDAPPAAQPAPFEPPRVENQAAVMMVYRIREGFKDPDVTAHCNSLIKAILDIDP